MMPPDHDRSIPQSRRDQIEALGKMFGDSLPTSQPTARRFGTLTFGAPVFRPQPGTLDETRREGQLFWLWHLPAPMRLDAHVLQVSIRHHALTGSRRAKTRTTCAELRKRIATLGGHLGVYDVPIDTPPSHWKREAVKDIVRLMATLLPAPGNADTSAAVDVETYRRHSKIEVTQYGADGTRQFVATVQLTQPPPALLEWTAAYGWQADDKYTHHDLIEFDALTPKRPTPGDESAHVREDDLCGDDDDLDAFEKAARRTLHGERAVPNTSRRRSDTTIRSNNLDMSLARAEIVKGVYELSDDSLEALLSLVRLWTQLHGGPQ
jgi:hypothetical protein